MTAKHATHLRHVSGKTVCGLPLIGPDRVEWAAVYTLADCPACTGPLPAVKSDPAKWPTLDPTAPVDELVRAILIVKGWTIDPAEVERPDGELRELVHPLTGEHMAWLDALLAQRDMEPT